jgi:hypothetical protein
MVRAGRRLPNSTLVIVSVGQHALSLISYRSQNSEADCLIRLDNPDPRIESGVDRSH